MTQPTDTPETYAIRRRATNQLREGVPKKQVKKNIKIELKYDRISASADEILAAAEYWANHPAG